jgi:hypothetical protein
MVRFAHWQQASDFTLFHGCHGSFMIIFELRLGHISVALSIANRMPFQRL